MIEYIKLIGVNGSVLAAVSLSDFELVLKVLLLLLTCVWTSIKIIKLLGEKD